MPVRRETLSHKYSQRRLADLYECRVYRHEDFVCFIFWGAVSDHSLEFMGVREKREKIYRYEAGLIEDNML